MLSYYMELISKPYYTLSYEERMYVDLFPYIVIALIAFIIVITAFIISWVKDKKK